MSNELPQLPLSEKEYADLTPEQIEAIIARELQKPADMRAERGIPDINHENISDYLIRSFPELTPAQRRAINADIGQLQERVEDFLKANRKASEGELTEESSITDPYEGFERDNYE